MITYSLLAQRRVYGDGWLSSGWKLIALYSVYAAVHDSRISNDSICFFFPRPKRQPVVAALISRNAPSSDTSFKSARMLIGYARLSTVREKAPFRALRAFS